MIDYAALMDSVLDKTDAPAFSNDYWTITQAELERFAKAVQEASAKIVETDMVPNARTPYQKQYNSGMSKLAEKIRNQ